MFSHPFEKDIILFESRGLFSNPENTLGAKDNVTGESLKKNKGKFFDDIYLQREYSSVLSHNKKLFDVFKNKEINKSWYYKNLEYSEYIKELRKPLPGSEILNIVYDPSKDQPELKIR